MRVINYIHIKNMIVHLDKRIEFTEGKNYITGPIGSGKTLINEAIAFSFFGSVALRDKSSSYKHLEVELSFNYKNQTFVIKRRIDDAQLFLLNDKTQELEEIVNSITSVNNSIISLLGYNYDIYLLSNYCKQKKLSQFSDMTASKRLQYIDKISGIEDAKEFLVYLVSRRKVLKSNIALLKDITVKPILNELIDLDFNYQEHLDLIAKELNGINDLYQILHELRQKIDIRIKEPVLGGNPLSQLLASFSEDEFNHYISLDKRYKELDNLIGVLESKVKDLPTLHPKYKSKTLEQIIEIINQYNLNIVHDVAHTLNGRCHSCDATFTLDVALDGSRSSLEGHNIKDLYNAKDYLENGIDEIRRALTKELRPLLAEFESFSENTVMNQIWSFKSINLLNNRLRGLEEKVIFDTAISEYQLKVREIECYREEASTVEDNITTFLNNQSDLINTRDSFVKLQSEKDVYLQQLELYNNSIGRYTEHCIELELVNNLIKDVTDISAKIKLDTIPLINQQASKYLNMITKGVMTRIEITDNYDLIVDGVNINLKSGGQQDLASLAFRLSLGQSIISGMLPLFIGDEIDSSGGSEDSTDISQALSSIAKQYQIILITHSDTTNIENENIIKL